MRVLLDNGVPRGVARYLTSHSDAAEQAGFEVMVTTDKNIRYQQNLKARKLSLIVLEHAQWPMVKLVVENIVDAVNAAAPGSYGEVAVPFKK